jgi:hypothetical protein
MKAHLVFSLFCRDHKKFPISKNRFFFNCIFAIFIISHLQRDKRIYHYKSSESHILCRLYVHSVNKLVECLPLELMVKKILKNQTRVSIFCDLQRFSVTRDFVEKCKYPSRIRSVSAPAVIKQ